MTGIKAPKIGILIIKIMGNLKVARFNLCLK